MLRILCCLALVISPVQIWSASAIALVYGSVQTSQPVALGNSTSLPGPLAELPVAWLGEEWWVLLAAIRAQARQPALGSRHGQGRRKRRRIRRVWRRRQRHRWLPAAVAWRQLKPVLEEIVQEANSSIEGHLTRRPSTQELHQDPSSVPRGEGLIENRTKIPERPGFNRYPVTLFERRHLVAQFPHLSQAFADRRDHLVRDWGQLTAEAENPPQPRGPTYPRKGINRVKAGKEIAGEERLTPPPTILSHPDSRQVGLQAPAFQEAADVVFLMGFGIQSVPVFHLHSLSMVCITL